MIISLAQIEVFIFIIARIAGLFISAPVFSSRSIPIFIKAAFAMWFTIVLWFVVPIQDPVPFSGFVFILHIFFEVLLGFCMGFIANLIFLGVQAAGELIDMQMGLSVATALDPIFGAVISVIGRLAFFTAIIIFLAVDGHHLLLSALHQSFTVIPAGKIANFSSPAFTEQMIKLGGMLWLTAIKIAMPAMLLIFLSDFTFGIVSRVAPQVNVFMLGFQVKPLLGIFTFMLCLPFIAKYIAQLVAFSAEQLLFFIQVVK